MAAFLFAASDSSGSAAKHAAESNTILGLGYIVSLSYGHHRKWKRIWSEIHVGIQQGSHVLGAYFIGTTRTTLYCESRRQVV